MASLMVICDKCETQFSTGFDIPLESLGEGNTSQCECGNEMELTAENVILA